MQAPTTALNLRSAATLDGRTFPATGAAERLRPLIEGA